MSERFLVAVVSLLLGCGALACESGARRPLQADAATGAGGGGGAAGSGGGVAGGGGTAGDGGGAAAAGGGGTAGDGGSAAGAGGGGAAGGSAGAGGEIDAGDGGGQIDAGDGGAADRAPMDAGACTAGIACTPANPCRTGVTSCTTGVAVCMTTTVFQPNGTPCGTNAVCVSGGCNNDCVVGPCTPTNQCHVGTHNCVTGVAMCHDTGTSVPDGTACGASQVCQSGNCVASLARSSP